MFSAVVIGVAGESLTFKEQVAAAVKMQRPQWKQDDCAMLTAFIVSELENMIPNGPSLNQASNIVEYLEHNLSMIDATPGDSVVALNKEYYRWAIGEYVKRKPIEPRQNNRLHRQIENCFSNAVGLLKVELPPDLIKQADEASRANCLHALKSMRDPLFPGLKSSIDDKEFDQFIKSCLDSWKKKQETFEKCGGMKTFKKESGEYDKIVSAGVQIPFMDLRNQIEYFGVIWPKEVRQAIDACNAERKSSFDKRRAERNAQRAEWIKKIEEELLKKELESKSK